MHRRFSRLHKDIANSYEATTNTGLVMSAAEAAEVSRLARHYNHLVWKSLKLMEGADHPTIEVVSKVGEQDQLGLQWRPFIGPEGLMSNGKLREVSLQE